MKYLVLDLEIAKKHNLKLYEVYVFAVFANNPDTMFNIVNFDIKWQFFSDKNRIFKAVMVLYKKGLIDQKDDVFMCLKK
jgi:predicted DNA-binding transcriptional regulator